MYKFIAYIPASHLEIVKNALFEAGAGQLGNYSHCAWQVLGTGQFKALKGASPAIGEIDKVEYVPEWRVEVIVPDEHLADVVRTYKLTHPYETPAYDVYKLAQTMHL